MSEQGVVTLTRADALIAYEALVLDKARRGRHLEQLRRKLAADPRALSAQAGGACPDDLERQIARMDEVARALRIALWGEP